ncbi:MAG: DUF3109 family protein [Saprospiraceae bacterium]
MIAIQDVLISDDVIDKQFVCNLSACKGACCWEGDYGAPVTTDEQQTLVDILDIIKPNLSIESNKILEKQGAFIDYKEAGFVGTTLHDNGACVFMTLDDNGTAKCGIEKTKEQGQIDFQKPMSCHMYPIRIITNEAANFEAWNYDQWDICSAACDLGKKEQVPVYKFLKNAIIKYKGAAFYDQLENTILHINEHEEK